MASKVKILRAGSLDDLEQKINSFLEQWGTDPRVEVDLIGGISFADDSYLAPMRLNAPHKRTFEEKEDTGDED